jgi:RHS repeat-associated protein
MEETHYYPFGLTMAGISSKAAGKLENKFKYNTWERNQDLSLEIDESFYRVNDYQTGRFWQPDPKIEWATMERWSPYVSNLDNPILYNDPKGDCPLCLIPFIIGGLIAAATPANPASSVVQKKEQANSNWEQARNNQGKQIAVALVVPGAINKLRPDPIESDPNLQGGRKGDIAPESNLDRHEVPSAQAMREGAGVKTDDVPAVQLPTPLHTKTATFGGGREARAARNEELGLIQNGQMAKAFENGVKDVRNLIQTKEGQAILKQAGLKVKDVEKGLQQMEQYFKKVFGQ